MFSIRLQSSYIRECPEWGCNLLDVVLIFISKCQTNSSTGSQTQRPDITYTQGRMKWIPNQNKCTIYFIISVDICIVNNIIHVHAKVYDRPAVGRSSADILLLSADGSLIKCHRPTVWRSSADWRPMIGRPSVDIMMKKSLKSRPIVGRWLGDHRPTPHRWQNTWKIGGSVNETFNLGASTKKSTKKSAKIRCRRRPTIGRRRPIFRFLAHRPSGDHRFG